MARMQLWCIVTQEGTRMPKSVTTYECTQCGNRNDDAEVIAKCEATHLKPVEIEETTYRCSAPVPTTIKIKLSDKQTVTYRAIKDNKMYQPTDEELKKAPCRVLYERKMFFASSYTFLKLHHESYMIRNNGYGVT
jgi:hypothetical protein